MHELTRRAAAHTPARRKARLKVKLLSALLCIALLNSAPIALHAQTRPARTVASTGRTIRANELRGADASAKLNAADAALGSSPGTIEWRGDGVITSSVIISPQHTLRLVSGHLTATNDDPVIRLKDDATLQCYNWDASISESTGKQIRYSALTIVGDYNGTQLNGEPSRNINVRGCHFKGMPLVTGRITFTRGSNAITSAAPLFTPAMADPAGPWTFYADGVLFAGTDKTVIATYVSPTRATLAAPAEQSTTTTAAMIHFASSYPAISLGNCQNCEVSGNWLERTNSIGINIGGGSMAGHYAQNFIVRDNLLTNVASQNISITNADRGQIIHNTMRNFGQPHGPGATAIDVEPNYGDRLTNARIADNVIDTTTQILIEALNGMAIQNTVGATPYGPIEVTNNRILGAPFAQPTHNGIQVYGILIRQAASVHLADNYVQRVGVGLQLDSGATRNVIERNTFASCGSGGTRAAVITDSTGNRISNNRFYDEPGSPVPGGAALARMVVEDGKSDDNLFENNDADVRTTGRRSLLRRRPE